MLGNVKDTLFKNIRINFDPTILTNYFWQLYTGCRKMMLRCTAHKTLNIIEFNQF